MSDAALTARLTAATALPLRWPATLDFDLETARAALDAIVALHGRECLRAYLGEPPRPATDVTTWREAEARATIGEIVHQHGAAFAVGALLTHADHRVLDLSTATSRRHHVTFPLVDQELNQLHRGAGLGGAVA